MPKRKSKPAPTGTLKNFRLPAPLLADFARCCQEEGYNQAEKLREMVREYVKNRKEG